MKREGMNENETIVFVSFCNLESVNSRHEASIVTEERVCCELHIEKKMSLRSRQPLKDVLSLSFNQDASCFCCGLANGFRVFTSDPYTESVRFSPLCPTFLFFSLVHTFVLYFIVCYIHHHVRTNMHIQCNAQFEKEFETGGVAVVEMLFRSNIFALVGGGPVPRFPPNKVMMWDDLQGRAIGELSFKSPVRAVKLRNDRIAVATEHMVYLYDIDELRKLSSVETAPNPDGLLALSPSEGSAVLACPGLHPGQVRIDLLDTKRQRIIDAHHSALSALALSDNAKYVATSSEKGTLIRIFGCLDGTKLREVRRGSDHAKMYSIAFSREETPEWLAVTSDKGTAHIFSLTGKKGNGNNSGTTTVAYHDHNNGQGEQVVDTESSLATSPSQTGAAAGSKGRLMMKSLSSLTVCVLTMMITLRTIFIKYIHITKILHFYNFTETCA